MSTNERCKNSSSEKPNGLIIIYVRNNKQTRNTNMIYGNYCITGSFFFLGQTQTDCGGLNFF